MVFPTSSLRHPGDTRRGRSKNPNPRWGLFANAPGSRRVLSLVLAKPVMFTNLKGCHRTL
jgi:hypothetical protein